MSWQSLRRIAGWLVVGVVILVTIGSLSTDSERESEIEPSQPYEPNLLDLARVELEMSHYCEDDLSPLESAARRLLVEELSTKDWTFQDYAGFIVVLEYLCDTWKAEGNDAVARLIYDESGDAIEAYLDQIGREEVLERVSEVQEQLEDLGDPQVLRMLMQLQ